MNVKFIEVKKVQTYGNRSSSSLYFFCNHFIAPIHEKIFAILGSDRILYTPIDSEIGKEYAVKLVKKIAWNVKKIKIGKFKSKAKYSIPKPFAKYLGISKGDIVVLLGFEDSLYMIPLRFLIERIEKEFREPMLR